MSDFNIESIRNQFLADFGVDRKVRQYHTPKGNVTVSGTPWTFTLRPVRTAEDLGWIALNSNMVGISSMAGVVHNSLNSERATVALAIAAINGIPSWKIVGVEPREEEKIPDPLSPPARMRYSGAKLLLGWLQTAEDGQTLVEWLYKEYNDHCDTQRVILPKGEVQEVHIFKCKDCHYDWEVPSPKMERLQGSIDEHGGLFCPSCGTIAPEVKSTNESPLGGKAPGDGS